MIQVKVFGEHDSTHNRNNNACNKKKNKSIMMNFSQLISIMQLVMLLWSYFTTVLTDPGGVPPNWRPSVDEERGDADPLIGLEHGSNFGPNQSSVFGDPANQRMRFCRKCNQFKPPRCHHCSVCKFLTYRSFKESLLLFLIKCCLFFILFQAGDVY